MQQYPQIGAPDMLLTCVNRRRSEDDGGHLKENRGMNPLRRVDEDFNPDDTLKNHQRSKYCKSAPVLLRRPRWCEETKAAAGSLTAGSSFNSSRCVFLVPLETTGGMAARSDAALRSEYPHFDHRHLFSSRMEMRGEAEAWNTWLQNGCDAPFVWNEAPLIVQLNKGWWGGGGCKLFRRSLMAAHL